MSPAVLLEQIRSAQSACKAIDLRGHAHDTRSRIYAARAALYRAGDVLALRSGETLTRGDTSQADATAAQPAKPMDGDR